MLFGLRSKVTIALNHIHIFEESLFPIGQIHCTIPCNGFNYLLSVKVSQITLGTLAHSKLLTSTWDYPPLHVQLQHIVVCTSEAQTHLLVVSNHLGVHMKEFLTCCSAKNRLQA